MVDVITSINIAAPIDKVAAYAMDQEHAPEWYVNIKSVEWLTSGPLALGSKFAFVGYFLGRKLAYVYEVVKLTETELVMSTSDGPFPMETTYLFEKIDENTTTMTLRNRGTPSGFSKLFSPFMSSMMRSANKKDLQSIKRIIEKMNQP